MASLHDQVQDDDLLEAGESPAGTRQHVRRPSGLGKHKDFLRQKAERFEFNILASEEDLADANGDENRVRIIRRHQSIRSAHQRNILKRAMARRTPKWRKDDPYYDLPEDHQRILEAEGVKTVKVPSLKQCRSFLQNPYSEAYMLRSKGPIHMVINLVLDTLAAFFIWFLNMFTLETCFVVMNASSAAVLFIERKLDWALKLDFSFLAFTVIFPLSFLIQSTFSRREQALSFLADFKSGVLSASLMTLTIDWPSKNGEMCNGRLSLPKTFNSQVTKDYRDLIKLVYEYLSMPRVSHARHHVFVNKRRATKKVHARQNGIVQEINDLMYDFALQTEEMKWHGFPSGEASRLHQYRQYVQQRFEHLRAFKYYRTPQATRSFGRVYMLVLPWIMGPYWSWVAEMTSKAYAILLAAFTFVVLLGLLNAQQGLEDPFVSDFQTLIPGIDTIKLDFELAGLLQAIEQYYANAELQRGLLSRSSAVMAEAQVDDGKMQSHSPPNG